MEEIKIIKCPHCPKGEISFDIKILLQGGTFFCPSCKTSIEISPEINKEKKMK